MENMVKKLTSRKFLLAVVCVVIGTLVLFKVDTEAIEELIGGALAVISAATYIVSEGKIDAAAAGKLADAAGEVTSAAEKIAGQMEWSDYV